MRVSFDNFDAFKLELEPSASKVGYQLFKSKMQKSKNVYDSNISAGIEFNKRIVEYKGKEQGLRA